MKTCKLLLGITVLGILVFSACKKSDDNSAATPTSSNSGGGNSISFKENGITYNLNERYMGFGHGTINGYSYTQIYAQRPSNEPPAVWISLAFPKNATVGKHELSDIIGNSYYTVEYKQGDNTFYNAGYNKPNNTMTINKIDTNTKVVSGTFQATVTNDDGATKSITNGSFTATYNK